jgi:hypothetical protein
MIQILKNVPFTSVQIKDSFWSPRLETFRMTTLPACLTQCETTGRIQNFDRAAGQDPTPFEGLFFNDSDVYKVIEGAAYSLMNHPDPELERKIDAVIDRIAAAQEEDGYLMTYFTVAAPDKKWTDMEKHEMYCGGHLIEAAVAYKQATGKDKLLQVACRLADHYDSLFGPSKRHWVEGHEEIELALVKLYYATGEERYWKLAHWLLEERGHGHGRGMIWDKEDWGPSYCQDDVPVRDIHKVTGHAVRAMYLYSGMADVEVVSGGAGYEGALRRVWDNVVHRNMYVTGGIGSSRSNEGFTGDYDLPNDTAYCETCAAIGMVLWNHRMNLLYGDAKYADVLERSMYNGVLAGLSLSGDKFFYVNPLSSDGSHHRVPWFDCSCCPTNIARFLPSIGNYVYAVSDNEVYVNLYLGNTGSIHLGNGLILRLQQTTQYPWNGRVEFAVQPEQEAEFGIRLRVPGWCGSVQVNVNGEAPEQIRIEQGYIRLWRRWAPGDRIVLEMDMPVERVYSHPLVMMNEGKTALQRGPLVYCLEQTDQEVPLNAVQVPSDVRFAIRHDSGLLGGITVIEGYDGAGQRRLTAVPYYAWDNREAGPMTVWIPEEQPKSLRVYTGQIVGRS